MPERQGAFEHRNAGTGDRHRRAAYGDLDAAGPAHLDALFDDEVSPSPRAGEQRAERAGGAAGRRVLGHAQRRAEHAGPHATGAGAGPEMQEQGAPPSGRAASAAAKAAGSGRAAARLASSGSSAKTWAGRPRQCAVGGAAACEGRRRQAGAGGERRGGQLGAELERLRRGDAGAVTAPPSRSTSARTGPAPSSKLIASPTGRPNTEPARASAKAVPTLGWPAKGSSAAG